MEPISFANITLTDGFWKQKQDQNSEVTIYAVKHQFTESGRFDAFDCRRKDGDKTPHCYWDSDVAKWLEAVAYILAKEKKPDLESFADQLIDKIAANMTDDGYFNTYFTIMEPDARFTRRTDHELYCAGHLMEAAVAYYYATGKDQFLRCMCRYADLIEKVFRIDQSAPFLTPGHEEIELALVKLYHCTHERRYLELAKYFVDLRGNNEKDAHQLYDFAYASYDQSHLPVREQTSAVGHSVRAGYLYSAMADLAYEYHDEALTKACKALFDDIVTHKLYITGGIGQSYAGESFTLPYDLPNAQAYAETCAAISLAYFASRMEKLEINSRYGDTLEKVIFNGILSGVSLDGEKFFYENPLEIDPYLSQRDACVHMEHRGHSPLTQRVKSFWCSCCPPNLNRFFASVGDYIYKKDYDTYYISQYLANEMTDGDITIKIETNYPLDGQVKIITNAAAIACRIPSWCSDYHIDAAYTLENGYAYIKRHSGEINIHFQMKPLILCANANVRENAGRGALQYGPLVYCLEEADNGKCLRSIRIRPNADFHIHFDETLHANVIEAEGFRPPEEPALYYPYTGKLQPAAFKWIPYYAFANRKEGEMLVWFLLMD